MAPSSVSLISSVALHCIALLSHTSAWSTRLTSNNHPSTSTTLYGSSRKHTNRIHDTKPRNRWRPQVDAALASIQSPPSFPYGVDPAMTPQCPPHLDPDAPLIKSIVHAADMRKAENIIAMRVTGCTSLCNFIVIVSGTSRPQNQAISVAIAKDLEEEYDGKRCLGKGVPEGSAESGWICLDYGEVMVHVMTPKSRLFYDLEGQWRERGGEYMDLSGVLIEDSPFSNKHGLGADASGNVFDIVGDSVSDEEEDEEEDDSGNGDDFLAAKESTLKERLDVEKEIDPFWS